MAFVPQAFAPLHAKNVSSRHFAQSCRSKPARSYLRPSFLGRRFVWDTDSERLTAFRRFQPRTSTAFVVCEQSVVLPSTVKLPPNRKLITVELPLPIGVVLDDDENGYIYIEDILPGGNAEKDGRLKVGDIIASTTATYIKNQLMGIKEVKMVHCDEPIFKDILAALNRDDRNEFLSVPLGEDKRTLIVARDEGLSLASLTGTPSQ